MKFWVPHFSDNVLYYKCKTIVGGALKKMKMAHYPFPWFFSFICIEILALCSHCHLKWRIKFHRGLEVKLRFNFSPFRNLKLKVGADWAYFDFFSSWLFFLLGFHWLINCKKNSKDDSKIIYLYIFWERYFQNRQNRNRKIKK